MSPDCTDARGKQDPVAQPAIEKRPAAGEIPGGQEPPAGPVPEDEREIAFQVGRALVPPGPVCRKDQVTGGGSARCHPQAIELSEQVLPIIERGVGRDREGPVGHHQVPATGDQAELPIRAADRKGRVPAGKGLLSVGAADR